MMKDGKMWIPVALAKLVQGVSTIEELRTKVISREHTVETTSVLPGQPNDLDPTLNVQASLTTREPSECNTDDGDMWTPVAPGKAARRSSKNVNNSSNNKGYTVYATGFGNESDTVHDHDRDGNPLIPSVQ
ncbi:unnamed protein product [Amaranthus hypochondriacus]